MSAVWQSEEGQVLVQEVVVGRERVRVRELDVGTEGVIEADADDPVHPGVDSAESGAGAKHGRRQD